MRAIYKQLELVAPTELSVLITGETGTGKELVAKAIHDASRRRDGPFVTIDYGLLGQLVLVRLAPSKPAIASVTSWGNSMPPSANTYAAE